MNFLETSKSGIGWEFCAFSRVAKCSWTWSCVGYKSPSGTLLPKNIQSTPAGGQEFTPLHWQARLKGMNNLINEVIEERVKAINIYNLKFPREYLQQSEGLCKDVSDLASTFHVNNKRFFLLVTPDSVTAGFFIVLHLLPIP